jgi:hypothetical protein
VHTFRGKKKEGREESDLKKIGKKKGGGDDRGIRKSPVG